MGLETTPFGRLSGVGMSSGLGCEREKRLFVARSALSKRRKRIAELHAFVLS